MEETKRELHGIIRDREMKEAVLLVFANKQDLPGGNNINAIFQNLSFFFLALTPDQLREVLELSSLSHEWVIFPSCAVSGEGLLEGMSWLAENMKRENK